MPQIFRHSTNYLARATIFGAIFYSRRRALRGVGINRSGWNTGQHIERQQPIQFSHKHHVGDDGIDCRYCHTSVETSASAGMPSTEVCMSCHKQIWADSPYLEPVRASFKTGKPLEWIRVHDLPDFSYFNHSIHVNKGVGCSTLSRTHRSDAGRVSGPHRCRWSGVSSVIVIRSILCDQKTKFSTWNGDRRKPERRKDQAGTEGQHSDQDASGPECFDKLFNLSSVRIRWERPPAVAVRFNSR